MKIVENTMWKKAMVDEIRSLLKKWHMEAHYFPTRKRVVDCKWVFSIKQKPDERYC
jgi:hypothetical protein